MRAGSAASSIVLGVPPTRKLALGYIRHISHHLFVTMVTKVTNTSHSDSMVGACTRLGCLHFKTDVCCFAASRQRTASQGRRRRSAASRAARAHSATASHAPGQGQGPDGVPGAAGTARVPTQTRPRRPAGAAAACRRSAGAATSRRPRPQTPPHRRRLPRGITHDRQRTEPVAARRQPLRAAAGPAHRRAPLRSASPTSRPR